LSVRGLAFARVFGFARGFAFAKGFGFARGFPFAPVFAGERDVAPDVPGWCLFEPAFLLSFAVAGMRTGVYSKGRVDLLRGVVSGRASAQRGHPGVHSGDLRQRGDSRSSCFENERGHVDLAFARSSRL
jgi:hypothetical protein